MSSTVLNITFDCADPRKVATFWGEVTGGEVIRAPNPGYPDCAVQLPGGLRHGCTSCPFPRARP